MRRDRGANVTPVPGRYHSGEHHSRSRAWRALRVLSDAPSIVQQPDALAVSGRTGLVELQRPGVLELVLGQAQDAFGDDIALDVRCAAADDDRRPVESPVRPQVLIQA